MNSARYALIGVALSVAAPAALRAQATSAADYVKMAGAGDQYEIQSSKLVLTSTRNPKVKSFATMMVKDHDASTADVKKAAMADKVKTGSPMLDADGRSMLGQLKGASGAARDDMYLDQQATAHQKALALHQGYADGGGSPALKAAAAKIAPVVQQHIDMLGQIKPTM